MLHESDRNTTEETIIHTDKRCNTCLHQNSEWKNEPCRSCIHPDTPDWTYTAPSNWEAGPKYRMLSEGGY
jgi:hypothetical protein